MTLALLDGDIVAYRAALGPQDSYDWGDTGGVVSVADPSAAKPAAIALAHEWAEAVKADKIIVALTGQEKFRKRLDPNYMANRAGKEKPLGHAEARIALQETFKTHLVEGLEGDDILGILATTPRYKGCVIVSADKDLKTIPGRLYNPQKGTGTRLISPEEANWWWMYQTLCGDATDGYKGCPRVGDKTAREILGAVGKPLGSLWAAVLKAFLDRKRSEQDALTQARCARILRREDYDSTTKEVILWHPTTPERMRACVTAPSPDVCAGPANGPAAPSGNRSTPASETAS